MGDQRTCEGQLFTCEYFVVVVVVVVGGGGGVTVHSHIWGTQGTLWL